MFLCVYFYSDINSLIAELTDEMKRDESIKHALEVRSTLATANYHKFFELFLKAPNMGAYLMDHFIERERIAALTVLCKAWVFRAIKIGYTIYTIYSHHTEFAII